MLLMKRKKNAQGADNSISCMNSHKLYGGRKKIRREEGGKTSHKSGTRSKMAAVVRSRL